MPTQQTREERAVAELRDGAATARTRAAEDLKAGRRTPSWILALAATRA